MTATAVEPVTVTYLRFRVVILDEHHVTIYAPDGTRLVAGVRMSESSVRAFIRGYRLQDRLDHLAKERKAA